NRSWCGQTRSSDKYDAEPRVRPERQTALLFGSRRAALAGARSTQTLGPFLRLGNQCGCRIAVDRRMRMSSFRRRDALKVLGTTALAGAAAVRISQLSAAQELRYPPEKGASLKVLRWKSFVQAAEDQFQLNTRTFVQ